MNDEYSLPEVRPDLKPLSPRVKRTVLGNVRDHEQTRSKVMTGLAILLVIASLVYFARWEFRSERSAVPPRSEQMAAPPKAKPTPVLTPAPVAPQFGPRTDATTTQYVKDPIRPQDTPPPEGKYREVGPDGKETIKPWPRY